MSNLAKLFHIELPLESQVTANVDYGLNGTEFTGTSTGGIPDLEGNYTNRYNLDNMYGSQNILKWSDLNSDGEESNEVDQRIKAEILRVQAYINDNLRHLYDVPFDPVPVQITDIATALVGHNLRDARHMDKDDSSVLRKYDRAMQTLHHIKSIAIILPDLKAKTLGSRTG